MDEMPATFLPYQNPRIENTAADGFPLILAEVSDIKEGRSRRSHLRILGGENTSVTGRSMIYSDTYSRATGDRTYSYARHSVNQEVFLEKLEEFLVTAILLEFSELKNRSAHCVIQTGDGIQTVDYSTYPEAVNALKSQPISFARLYFPFGDMTVEFREHANIVTDEFKFISSGVLGRSIESPLFAFEVNESDIWTVFLASIHWARDLLTPEVLRQVLRMAARVPA